ncbi:MAG: hypothetical protein M3Q98_12535 [Actinomycetota bacterium]|nr:hypothetical protein [Actinomycetota bacterium]
MQSTEVRQELSADIQDHPEADTVANFLDFESLTEEHGAALCALAAVILIDRERAEDEVAKLLVHACSAPVTTLDGGSRRVLSRRLYLNCAWTRLVSGLSLADPLPHKPSTDSFADRIDQLTALSEQQRSAIALFLYGDHSYQEVAELIGLPAPVVVGLLRSGLAELRF